MSELESHKRSNQESTWISKQGRKGKEVQLTKATMRILLGNSFTECVYGTRKSQELSQNSLNLTIVCLGRAKQR